LAELTGQVQEGLLSLAVATGLQVMGQLMEADVVAAAGPRAGRTRNGPRSGTAPGRGRGR